MKPAEREFTVSQLVGGAWVDEDRPHFAASRRQLMKVLRTVRGYKDGTVKVRPRRHGGTP